MGQWRDIGEWCGSFLETCYYSVLLQCDARELVQVLAKRRQAISKERLEQILATDPDSPLIIDWLSPGKEPRFRRGLETVRAV